MGHFSSMFSGLARSMLMKGKCSGKCGKNEAVEAKKAKKNDLILRSSGIVDVDGSNNFFSVCSRKGNKAANQDRCIVWERFGCQEDMMFCGVFDGHGTWGQIVARIVRDSMPSFLLQNWQKALVEASNDPDFESDEKLQMFDIWKRSYIEACAAVDEELQQQQRKHKIDSHYSGTTAVTIVRQGDILFIANVGDSRAVLATTSDDGRMVPVQLTVDQKPNLPQEKERIVGCKGRVFCLEDEPGVHRMWLPDEEIPGLSMSRAFGDYCVKDFGLTSAPEVTHREITAGDQFVILASDGVWDVVSNEEAVQIVGTSDRGKSAKRLVKSAVDAWKRKRRGIAVDDISAICLFFHPFTNQVHPVTTPK